MLYKHFTYKNSNILVWKIEESIEEIKALVFDFLPIEDKDKFLKFKTKHRQKEWLLSRYLLKKAINSTDKIIVKYDNYGKPYLDNYWISISHSKDFVAVILSSKNNVAIDIQEITEKTVKVSHKFLSSDEITFFDINDAKITSLLWSIKETAYKLYGKKNLPFKNGIKISPFILDIDKNTEVIVKKNIINDIAFLLFENNFLTFSVQ